MNALKKTAVSFATVAVLVGLVGCTVAEAGSPDSKNTPRPSTTPTGSSSQTPTPPVEAEPAPVATPTADVTPPWSWREVDGTWCASGDCLTITDSSYSVGTDFWLLRHTTSEQGCFQGTLENIDYPGSRMMYCPAGTPTPYTIIHPAATSAAEAVLNDDPSKDRMWFYQGMGADTYFRQ